MIITNYGRLKNSILRRDSLQIINSGLGAIKTEKIVRDKIRLKNNILYIKNYENNVKKFNLRDYKNIYVVGFGKASSLMAKELDKILGNKINSGVIISTKKEKLRNRKIKIFIGTHPMPSLKNIDAAKKIVDLIKNLDKNDLVICLVSGGGSALLCYPKIPFEEYMKIINKHFASGIDIRALNKIRKKLSYVKSGKLAKLTKAKIISLIFSDVVGDDLSIIASGPTVGKNLRDVKNILLLNNQVALNAMYNKALSLGYIPIIYTSTLKGEARIVGKNLIRKVVNNKDIIRLSFKNKLLKNIQINKNILKTIKDNKKINLKKIIKIKKQKIALLFAGETTVAVKGSGKGGRCQELCLGAMEEIAKLKDSCLIAIGSDGRDGPTDAAGAVIDSNSFGKAKKLRVDYKKYLANNDSYHFFKKMGDLIFTGLTGSNIADIGTLLF